MFLSAFLFYFLVKNYKLQLTLDKRTVFNIQIAYAEWKTLTMCSVVRTQIIIYLEIFVQYSQIGLQQVREG